MESQAVLGAECRPRNDFVSGEPSLVGEGVFQLVAIACRVWRPYDGRHLGQVEFADASQQVLDEVLFEFELLGIIQYLPLATPAHTEVLAESLAAHRRRASEGRHRGLGIVFFLFPHLQVYYVSRHGIGDEDDIIVEFRYCFAFVGNGGDFDILERGEFFLLACQC